MRGASQGVGHRGLGRTSDRPCPYHTTTRCSAIKGHPTVTNSNFTPHWNLEIQMFQNFTHSWCKNSFVVNNGPTVFTHVQVAPKYKRHPNFNLDFLVWDHIEIIVIWYPAQIEHHNWKDAPLVLVLNLGTMRLTHGSFSFFRHHLWRRGASGESESERRRQPS